MFRDREKVMRGLKKMDTPIIEGYRIYHNYIRGHAPYVEKHQQIWQVSKWKDKTNGLL
jgi:hypothetical protein